MEGSGYQIRLIRKAIVGILSFPMDDVTFMQVSLTPKLGGLGLRQVTEHADMAYHASWHESQRTAVKCGLLRQGCLPNTFLNQ